MKPEDVLVVDDDSAVRAAIVMALSAIRPQWRIALCHSGEEAVDKAPLLQPGRVVLDVRMGGMCGFECLNQLRPILPASRIILFTAFGSKDVAHHTWIGNADGFVQKGLSLKPLLDSLGHPPSRRRVVGLGLTPREHQFLQLLAADLGNKGIAAELNLSRQYVDNRLSGLYQKLGVHSAAGAIARAANLGLLDLSGYSGVGEKSTHSHPRKNL